MERFKHLVHILLLLQSLRSAFFIALLHFNIASIDQMMLVLCQKVLGYLVIFKQQEAAPSWRSVLHVPIYQDVLDFAQLGEILLQARLGSSFVKPSQEDLSADLVILHLGDVVLIQNLFYPELWIRLGCRHLPSCRWSCARILWFFPAPWGRSGWWIRSFCSPRQHFLRSWYRRLIGSLWSKPGVRPLWFGQEIPLQKDSTVLQISYSTNSSNFYLKFNSWLEIADSN